MYESVLAGDYIMACLRSNVNSDQWNGGDRPSAIGIRSRLMYNPDERPCRVGHKMASSGPRSMENASCADLC